MHSTEYLFFLETTQKGNLWFCVSFFLPFAHILSKKKTKLLFLSKCSAFCATTILKILHQKKLRGALSRAVSGLRFLTLGDEFLFCKYQLVSCIGLLIAWAGSTKGGSITVPMD
jgi:hypothetical protein